MGVGADAAARGVGGFQDADGQAGGGAVQGGGQAGDALMKKRRERLGGSG
jgi:hypothetical protein